MRPTASSYVQIVLALLFLSARAAGAQQPAPAAPFAWEYGVLELAPTGNGLGFVFCRLTTDGCDETVLDVRARPIDQPPPAVETRQGRFETPAARAIARLGREGWELTLTSDFGRQGDSPVLYFKRSLSRR
jgi:hypothetical protein